MTKLDEIEYALIGIDYTLRLFREGNSDTNKVAFGNISATDNLNKDRRKLLKKRKRLVAEQGLEI